MELALTQPVLCGLPRLRDCIHDTKLGSRLTEGPRAPRLTAPGSQDHLKQVKASRGNKLSSYLPLAQLPNLQKKKKRAMGSKLRP